MQRLHINIGVNNLEQSIGFYSTLLGEKPGIQKPDYAKWLLDDPRINLSISTTGKKSIGINHLGIQTETHDELEIIHNRLQAANQTTVDEPGAQCCYAESDKHWATDPSGVVWELFKTMRQTDHYGNHHQPLDETVPVDANQQTSCCVAT